MQPNRTSHGSAGIAKALLLLLAPLALTACGKVDRLGTQASVIPDVFVRETAHGGWAVELK